MTDITAKSQLGKQIFQVATYFFEFDCVLAAIWAASILEQPYFYATLAKLAITVAITACVWSPCNILTDQANHPVF